MFRIDGFGPQDAINSVDSSRARLAAILVERRKGNKRDEIFSAAIGTRINVHFGLIHKFLPDMGLDQLLANELKRRRLEGGV